MSGLKREKLTLNKMPTQEWREKNREKIRKYDSLYAKKHKEERCQNILNMKRKYPWYRVYHGITSKCYGKNKWHYRRGIKNFLTPLKLKFLWYRDKAYLLKEPSIHRKNPKGNYTLKNCRFIELIENCREGGGNCYKYRKGIFKKKCYAN